MDRLKRGNFVDNKMEINFFTSDTKCTIFWDEQCDKSVIYNISIDGKCVANTKHTHYSFYELIPDTSYQISVSFALEGLAGESSESMSEIIIRTSKSKERLDISKAPYNAPTDGETLCTEIVQRAIDDCRADQMVYIPKGVFVTGALDLHSNMELYLEEGACLRGTADPKDYLPMIWSRFEGTELECYKSYLNLGKLSRNHDKKEALQGESFACENVVISGKGTIESGGAELAKAVTRIERERLKSYMESLGDKLSECERADTIPSRLRPRLINMSNCRNIRISGLTLANGASWNVHMIYSKDIVTNGCTFKSVGVWNGDGWDPDSSENCTLFDCSFYTGDDAVAIKSGKNPEGNIINKPTRNIRIFDCKSFFGHGITIGSEMSGGIDDIRIWDCDMGTSMCGIEVKGTKKRGGFVSNISVHNVITSRIWLHSVGYNDDGEGWNTAPVFEDCSFKNVTIYGRSLDHESNWNDCDAIELSGFDEPGREVKNIIFEDITLGKRDDSRRQTFSLQRCTGVQIKNLQCF